MLIDFKTLTRPELEEIFDGVPFGTPPRLHQLQSLAWMADKRRVAYWGDIGVGKTLVALYAMRLWGAERVLVVCPNSVVRGWAEQIAEHTDATFRLLTGTRTERMVALKDKADVYVINYEGLRVLFGKTVKRLDPRTGKWKHVLQIQYNAISQAGFDGLVVDECHHCKTRDAKQTQLVHAIAKGVQRCLMMTGSPVATGHEDLWAQYWCLDDGRTFNSDSFYKFMNCHFVKWKWGWTIKPHGKEDILEAVAPVTLRFDRDECGELPEKVYVDRRAEMTREQRVLTQSLLNGLAMTVDGHAMGEQDALHLGAKLAQVAGGFFFDDDGEAVRLKDNPKLDLLQEIVEDCGEKLIIFHEYVEEGRMIAERLKRMKVPHAQLRGEIKNKDGEYERFKADKECRVLVAHPQSGGEGLNLQAASVIWFYSSTTSGAVTRPQCEGRIWRLGQEQKCVIGDVILAGSIDERKLSRCADRKAMAAEVLAYVRAWRD